MMAFPERDSTPERITPTLAKKGDHLVVATEHGNVVGGVSKHVNMVVNATTTNHHHHT